MSDLLKYVKKLETKVNKKNAKPRLEKSLELECQKIAKAQGYAMLKLVIDGNRGFPDRTLLKDGKTLFVEFKREGSIGGLSRLSKQQLGYKKLLESLGFEYHVVDSVNQFEELLNR